MSLIENEAMVHTSEGTEKIGRDFTVQTTQPNASEGLESIMQTGIYLSARFMSLVEDEAKMYAREGR